jgi:hypothetical protein
MKNSDAVFGVAASSKKGVDTCLPSGRTDLLMRVDFAK